MPYPALFGREEAVRIVGVRWQIGVVGVAVGQMPERRHDEVASVTADSAEDVAPFAGGGVEALHEGQIAVACRAQQGVEVCAGVVGDRHEGLLK